MTGGRDTVAELASAASGPDQTPGPARQGFDDFVRAHYGHLVAYLRRRTGTAEDAEDIAQESLIRLLRYRQTEASVSWRPLLYRIATNVSHDHARSAIYHGDGKHLAIEDHEVADEGPSPEEQVMRAQQLALMRRAVLTLPPKCRRVYLLKRKYGLSRAQIAQRCGISVKMVEKHLFTALLHIQRKVGSDRGQPS